MQPLNSNAAPASYNALDHDVESSREIQSEEEVSDEDDEEEDDEGETIISPARPFHEEHKPPILRDNLLGKAPSLQRITSFEHATLRSSGSAYHLPKSNSSDLRKNHHNYHQEYRMVDRDGDFHQSRGKFSVRKKIKRKDWRSLYGYDVFHSLVNAPTMRTIGILLAGYFFIIVIFSVPYYLISRVYGCNMGIETYLEAFLFSLESMATVGYGTQDIFFDDCLLPMIVLTAQMLVRIVCDAGTIGIIYARLARPTTRASTILFSNHAIIRRVRGKLYFMFQLCELRKHQLVEAHVRLYVFRQDSYVERGEGVGAGSSGVGTSGTTMAAAVAPTAASSSADSHDTASSKVKTHFQTSAMRLNHPNDDLGSMLLMCLPQVVVHELDASSPLMPQPNWTETQPLTEGRPAIEHRWAPPSYQFAETEIHPENATPGKDGLTYEPSILNNLGFPSVIQKNPYNFVNTRELVGSGFEKMRHGERVHSAGLEDYTKHFDNPPLRGSNATTAADGARGKSNDSYRRRDDESEVQLEERRMIQTYMRDKRMEVVAIVEGMDAATGGVVQARHSFVCDEVKWHKTFVPCVHEDEEEGVAVIDFSVFHKLKPTSVDSTFTGVVSSCI